MQKNTNTLSLGVGRGRNITIKDKISELLKIDEKYKELSKYVNDITICAYPITTSRHQSDL